MISSLFAAEDETVAILVDLGHVGGLDQPSASIGPASLPRGAGSLRLSTATKSEPLLEFSPIGRHAIVSGFVDVRQPLRLRATARRDGSGRLANRAHGLARENGEGVERAAALVGLLSRSRSACEMLRGRFDPLARRRRRCGGARPPC